MRSTAFILVVLALLFGQLPVQVANAASAAIKASSLRLSNSAFAPAKVNGSKSKEVSNTDADHTFFAHDHGSAGYAHLGRTDGYLQVAQLGKSGPAGAIAIRYMASIFTSQDVAGRAWTDGVTHTQSAYQAIGSPVDCKSLVSMNCEGLAFTYNSQHTARYLVLQRGACLAELGAEYPSNPKPKVRQRIDNIMVHLRTAAAAVLKKNCPLATPTFTLDAVTAYNGKNQRTTAFSKGQTVVVVLAYTIHDLKGSTPITISRVYQAPAKKGWQSLSHPVKETFDTAGGSKTYRFSFTMPGGFSRIRVVFTVSALHKTQQKFLVLKGK